MSIKYWEEMYGKRSKDFIDGVIAGIEYCATSRNEEAVVGAFNEPFEKVIAEVKEQLG
jgi:hypothetical protein